MAANREEGNTLNTVEIFPGFKDSHEELPGRSSILRLELTDGEIGPKRFVVIRQRHFEVGGDWELARARVAFGREVPALVPIRRTFGSRADM